MYQHTQRGDVILAAAFLSAPLVFFSTLLTSPLFALPSAIGIFALLMLFSTLTVSVDEERIQARFGPGLIRFGWQRDEVVSAEAVQTPWYSGYGIRYIGNGWLYNVSGKDGVELKMRDGRRVRLGTDDVAGLLAALEA